MLLCLHQIYQIFRFNAIVDLGQVGSSTDLDPAIVIIVTFQLKNKSDIVSQWNGRKKIRPFYVLHRAIVLTSFIILTS